MQNFVTRNWEEVRDAWLENVPNFPSVGAKPNPDLEHLQPLLDIELPIDHDRFPDIAGLRTIALWEAVFLFHKCSHTNLAAQRLGRQGMHSWCLFNGYHSAYLGARGIMALLGVALPDLKGRQVAIDLCPEPVKKKKTNRPLGSPQFQEFIIVPLPHLDQRDLWQAFQRVIRVSRAACWDIGLRTELLGVSHERISPPRNHFLYKAHYWPLGDLASDVQPSDMTNFFGTELDAEDPGFLLRLSFAVYRLFEQLMNDLAVHSAVIEEQLKASRFLATSELPELGCYRNFLSTMDAQSGRLQ